MRPPYTASVAPGLLLQAWFSPSFPTGAFAYSHGLELAQETGDVRERASLEAWLDDLIAQGSVRGDLVIASIAHRAFETGDDALLKEVAELAVALSPSQERHLETTQQGKAFFSAIATGWPFPELERFGQVWPGEIALPVAVGVAAAGHGIDRAALLPAFGLGALVNLVSAAIRLGIVGQTDGQKTIAALVGRIGAVASGLTEAGFDDLGSASFRSDLASLRHETQYTRLFRS